MILKRTNNFISLLSQVCSAYNYHFASPSARGVKYCDHHVCMYVCLSVCLFVCLSACVSQKLHVQNSKFHEIFVHVICSRGSFLPTTAQYVMYFRFCGLQADLSPLVVANGLVCCWRCVGNRHYVSFGDVIIVV